MRGKADRAIPAAPEAPKNQMKKAVRADSISSIPGNAARRIVVVVDDDEGGPTVGTGWCLLEMEGIVVGCCRTKPLLCASKEAAHRPHHHTGAVNLMADSFSRFFRCNRWQLLGVRHCVEKIFRTFIVIDKKDQTNSGHSITELFSATKFLFISSTRPHFFPADDKREDCFSE